MGPTIFRPVVTVVQCNCSRKSRLVIARSKRSHHMLFMKIYRDSSKVAPVKVPPDTCGRRRDSEHCSSVKTVHHFHCRNDVLSYPRQKTTASLGPSCAKPWSAFFAEPTLSSLSSSPRSPFFLAREALKDEHPFNKSAFIPGDSRESLPS